MVVAGVFLLPFGVVSLKDEWKKLKDLSLKKKVVFLVLEVIDIFTYPIFSAWLLGLSLLLIVGGLAIIVKESLF